MTSRSTRARSTRSPTAISTSSGAPPAVFDTGRRRRPRPTRARRRCCRSRRGSRVIRDGARPTAGRRRRTDRGRLVRRADRRLLPRPRRRLIVRGLRAISDFETEMQLAHNNRVLAPDVDTVFFMTAVENGYVSSSLVKEIAALRRRRLGDGPGRGRRRPSASALAERADGAPRARRAIIARPTRASGPTPTDAGGHSDRHHLPRRAPRVADRQRQEAAAHDERRRRPERGARPHRRAAGRRARGGPRRQADQRRGRADHREGPGGGRADRRAGPGAGGVPHRRARPDPAGRGESRRIIAEAARDADEIRRGADEYAVSVLVGLEGDVVKTLQSIKKGIALLDERRAELRPEADSAPSDDDDGDWRGRGRGGRGAAGPRDDAARPADGPPSSGTSPGCSPSRRRRPRVRRSTASRSSCRDDLRLTAPIDGRVRLPRTNRGVLVDADLDDGARGRVRPLPPRHRGPDRGRDRGGGPARHRHRTPAGRLAGRRRAEVAAPDRPPRAGPRAAGARRDPPGRADRAALTGPIARACASSAAAPRRGRPRPSRRRHRPAPRGAAGLPADDA